ncbi:MAG: DNA mismatch repair protein MutS [Pseudomonadota bacterium]
MGSNTAATPMMAQYLEIKEAYPDALLFYRMGDFYELFFDDAVAAAAALDISLTKRGKHLGEEIPMCGVPVHAAEGYLHTLIRKGFRVAVGEQLESPEEAKKRGSKSVVKRGVVRLVTPGTLTEESLLEARSNNFLAAFAMVRDDGALAWVDISTGALRVSPCPRVKLGPMLARTGPSEVLLSEAAFAELSPIVQEMNATATEMVRGAFDSDQADALCHRIFGVASLDVFASFTRAEKGALGALLNYLELTQKGKLPTLRAPIRELETQSVEIDAATRASLELTRSMTGGRAGSLLATIDRTLTAPGARMLMQRVTSPSRDLELIRTRLDETEALMDDAMLREDLRAALRNVPDLDRALSRLALERGGPRDLSMVARGIGAAERAAALLAEKADILSVHAAPLTALGALSTMLEDALVAEPPLLAREGGFVATGHDAALDELRVLRDEGRGFIASLQAKYAELTGVGSLKVKYNNVLGYFIETTATHAEKMLGAPLTETFIHRQTTANAVRFTTVELSELETKILNAGQDAITIELRIFGMLREAVCAEAEKLTALSDALAALDIAAAQADLAQRLNWARPELTAGQDFHIEAGRHPVVEAALDAQAQSFVANDCDLSDAHVWLLTGPNMAGKSTFLRQNALIALLAQIGSYVPAARARIGIVSQIFSRVGASDDLARGRSTFMVEMVETAAILNQADERALVILDEIGRGTSTYDGLSIAWAALEHLHDVNGCRALFATHYHEMTALSGKLDRVENATVTVKEHGGDVVFLHEVRKGTADRSYGVQVAKLAGLPPSVIDRARVVLEALEKGEREGGGTRAALIDDLPLFAASAAPPPAHLQGSEVEARLSDIHPDDLSAKAALDLLYELKSLMK